MHRVLIIGLNYAPEMVGIGPYTAGAAQALAASGVAVEVIAAQPYYPDWKVRPDFRKRGYRASEEDGVRVVRCPLYVPAAPSGARRLVHHASFALSALPAAWRAVRERRPDLVIQIAPSLIATPVARFAAHRARAPLWIHVQDFEVEAAFATGLLKADSRLGRLAMRFEASQFARADRVSTISPQMVAVLARKGIAPERLLEARNWANVADIRPLATRSPYRAQWGITTPHVALYSGNIANKQGLEIIVAAARLLAGRGDLTFVICGEGPNRATIAAATADLPNVQLHDLQPAERMSELLGLATVHLLPQIVGATDLVLPSKMANMLASGRPVVGTALPGTGIADELDGCGIVTPPGDAPAFAAAIAALIDDPARCARLGAAARARAEARWSRDALLAGFVAQVRAVLDERAPVAPHPSLP